MLKLSFFILVFFVAEIASAQKDLTQYYIEQSQLCGGVEELMKIKGSWKQHGDVVSFDDNSFPKSQYKLLLSQINDFLPLFKEACPDLGGIEPAWYRSARGNSYILKGPIPYEFTSLYFCYYCNRNLKKILAGGETSTWAYIFVNHYNWLCQEVGEWDITGNGKPVLVYELPPKIGTWKGLALYEPFPHGKFCRAVVISYNGKSPWHSLTQKEYLTGLKNFWSKKKNDGLADYDKQEEKMKAYKVPSTVSPDLAKTLKEQQEKQLKDFQDNKEKFKSNTAKFYDEKINPIDNYLTNAKEDVLNQPAIIDPKYNYNTEGFKGKFGDEEKRGMRLITFDPSYFNNKLPRYAPQFMVLYWRWSEEPPSLSFKKQFEEDFPIEKLIAMLPGNH